MARAASRTTDRPVVAGVPWLPHAVTRRPASKLDLARHYEGVSRWMRRDLIDRPLPLVRCPKGVPLSGAQKGRTIHADDNPGRMRKREDP
jgi:hypothetical protein